MNAIPPAMRAMPPAIRCPAGSPPTMPFTAGIPLMRPVPASAAPTRTVPAPPAPYLTMPRYCAATNLNLHGEFGCMAAAALMTVADFDLLRFAVALLGTAACTYYDLTHNRTVPDWLTVGLVALGVLANIFAFAVLGAEVAWMLVVLPAVFVMAFGYLLYKAGQLGGADVLLYVAIALLVPVAPAGLMANTAGSGGASYYAPVFPFILSIFLVSGVVFGIASFARYFPLAIMAWMKGKVEIGREKAVVAGAMALLGAAALWTGLNARMPLPFLLIVLAAVVFAEFFYVFKEFISRNFLIEYVTLAEIDEEDVLATEEMDAAVVKKYGLEKLLTPKEIAKLRKMPLKKFPVYKNLPAFMPYMLAAMVLSLLFGDVLALAVAY